MLKKVTNRLLTRAAQKQYHVLARQLQSRDREGAVMAWAFSAVF
jgi:hypothetical protein